MGLPLIIHSAPSPNFDERHTDVDTVILHYTGMQTGAAALARLRDPAARVSAHYLVEEDGMVFSLVEEEKRAWHAGVSSWKGETNLNARSVGIEIVNPGHEWGYRPFPDDQIDAVCRVLHDTVARWSISLNRVLGHSDIAPHRKDDPGELFPWNQLADLGLAVGPFVGAPDPSILYEDALTALNDIGYDAPDGRHAACVLAFQRRFCPASLGQALDPLTKAAILWTKSKMVDRGA
ncbi:MAG: N-acetylmuramoyl-L-alanine amidase [Pseudomonadota bacterium]